MIFCIFLSVEMMEAEGQIETWPSLSNDYEADFAIWIVLEKEWKRNKWNSDAHRMWKLRFQYLLLQ